MGGGPVGCVQGRDQTVRQGVPPSLGDRPGGCPRGVPRGSPCRVTPSRGVPCRTVRPTPWAQSLRVGDPPGGVPCHQVDWARDHVTRVGKSSGTVFQNCVRVSIWGITLGDTVLDIQTLDLGTGDPHSVGEYDTVCLLLASVCSCEYSAPSLH